MGNRTRKEKRSLCSPPICLSSIRTLFLKNGWRYQVKINVEVYCPLKVWKIKFPSERNLEIRQFIAPTNFFWTEISITIHKKHNRIIPTCCIGIKPSSSFQTSVRTLKLKIKWIQSMQNAKKWNMTENDNLDIEKVLIINKSICEEIKWYEVRQLEAEKKSDQNE